jgi:hypothetical protein
VRALACGFALALLGAAGAARADWLTLGSRAISRGASADPDAPVVAYGYGPRARASLGGDVALLTTGRRGREFRLGAAGLFAVEDAESKDATPNEVGRSLLALSATWAYFDALQSVLPLDSVVELGLEIGGRNSFAFDHFLLGDPYHADDVPFGAGGNYLGVDAALRAPMARRFVGVSRLTLRAYTNAFPALFGQAEASDHVASSLEEGAELSAALELGARFLLTPRVQPVLNLYADVIEPHDDSAKTLWLVRGLLGVAIPGGDFELDPYVDMEAGHGQGLLVNRTELRLGAGARLYAR